MRNNSKSPNKFIGSLSARLANGENEGLPSSFLSSNLAQAAGKISAKKVGALATLGARRKTRGSGGGVVGRLADIESRVQALEGGESAANTMQPPQVVPSEPFTDPFTGAEISLNQSGNPSNPEANSAAARDALAQRTSTFGAIQPQAIASEELGTLMASPFTMRQRKKMGPLNLKK
jgi:hypothetical protein